MKAVELLLAEGRQWDGERWSAQPAEAGSDAVRTLSEIRDCFAAWIPNARPLGNVTAADAVPALVKAIAILQSPAAPVADAEAVTRIASAAINALAERGGSQLAGELDRELRRLTGALGQQ